MIHVLIFIAFNGYHSKEVLDHLSTTPLFQNAGFDNGNLFFYILASVVFPVINTKT